MGIHARYMKATTTCDIGRKPGGMSQEKRPAFRTLSAVGPQHRKQCIYWTGSSKPCGPAQAGPLAHHLPWLIQIYNIMGGKIPDKA